MLNLPEVNSVWEHHSGRRYKVLHIANEPNDTRYPLSIVYQGTNGKIWVRVASDWHRSMTKVEE